MNTALQQQRLEVEQLRREAAMKRIPVSQAVEDIKVKKNHYFGSFSLKHVRTCLVWNLTYVGCCLHLEIA